MASVRQYFDDPRLAGLDLTDSCLMGFVFEQGHAIRLFCDFHLTREHPQWMPFNEAESWACYRRGSILLSGCKSVALTTGSPFPADLNGFDCDTMDTFEVHDTFVKIETNSLKFEIHTTDIAVELDRVEI